MRIGTGYDVHRLIEKRPLILGGCTIPFEKGLLGHSDADVLTHAIIDALLGAASMGDIGRHFPDTDARHKNASSMHMLEEVGRMLKGMKLTISNIDSTIVAERPKLAGYLPMMEENIARALRASVRDINVKATTEEGLGFTGIGEGIAAHASVLVKGNG